MADSAVAPPAPPAAEPGRSPGCRGETVASVAESFTDLQRTVRRSKARLLAAAGNDVESASQILLHTVGADDPMRASALAASVQSDLSTVSRQVAVLVAHGLLERQADQLDGRASLLAVTAAGRAAIAEHEQGRDEFFDEVLTGWSTEEMHQFARQLERFTAAYDHVHAARMNELPGRLNSQPGSRARGTGPHHHANLEEGPDS
jgi:DNA-binding MarR family transcriptional regulator